METPEEMVEAYKNKQKDKIAQEDEALNRIISKNRDIENGFNKIAKELHAISQELNTLNKLLRRK